MIDFILLLLRHLLTGEAAWLTEHGIDASSTVSLVVGLICLLIPMLWSYYAKMRKYDDTWKVDPKFSDAVRTALGSIASQVITYASVYWAIDANNPVAFATAALNALASHYGLHQQIAHATPVAIAQAVKAMVLMLCVDMLVSCQTMKKMGAALSTPQAVQIEASLADLSIGAAKESGLISEGDAVAISKGVAIITTPGNAVSKIVPLTDLVTDTAVSKNLLTPGTGLLIKAGTAIVVKPATPSAPATPVPAPVAPAPAS